MDILYSPEAAKFLQKLTKSNPKPAASIVRKIYNLAENPNPPGRIKMKGAESEYWRVVAGAHRIVYSVHKNILTVEFIDKRNDDEVYRRFNRRK
ncbi:MAG: type II toxin-antitoxin system RelE/ParE family toxin [Betaproteobacteria bacterium]|nr:type II toxin-antitoxin system RelE/ParE family toxin [Betaproteobacteria bacterium]